MKTLRISILLLVAVPLIFLVSCGKQDAKLSSKILPAKVTLVMGNAYLLREDQPEKIALKIGTLLKPADVVITGKNSGVNVVIAKRGVFKIKENSRVSFKDLLVIDDENNVARLQVAAGKVILGLKKLKKDSVFEVETPTAVAGVRGTSFAVSVSGTEPSAFPYFVKVPKESTIVTKVGVLTGKVELSNPNDSDQKVAISALKQATLINDDFDNIKIEKIEQLNVEEISSIKELSEVRALKLKEISDEISSSEPQVENMMKSDIKTKSDVKSTAEDLKKKEAELGNQKLDIQKESIKDIKDNKKDSGKYLNGDQNW